MAPHQQCHRSAQSTDGDDAIAMQRGTVSPAPRCIPEASHVRVPGTPGHGVPCPMAVHANHGPHGNTGRCSPGTWWRSHPIVATTLPSCTEDNTDRGPHATGHSWHLVWHSSVWHSLAPGRTQVRGEELHGRGPPAAKQSLRAPLVQRQSRVLGQISVCDTTIMTAMAMVQYSCSDSDSMAP